MQNEFEAEIAKEEKSAIYNGVMVSFALHALIASSLILKAVFFDEPLVDYAAAIRVDIVGLPEKLTELPEPPGAGPDETTPPAEKDLPEKAAEEAPKEPEPVVLAEKAPEKPKAPEKKPEPTKPAKESVNLDKTKSEQKSALAKLKAMAALEKIKEEAQRETAKKSATGGGTAANRGAPVRGNIINPGTSLTGLEKIQHDGYLAQLDKHIKQNWSLPQWLSEKEYQAQVRVQIDKNGLLVGKKLLKSSGNPTYDEYALETIDRSIPFPRPPEKLTAILEVNGFVVGFPE